jgi:hypothetical protein
MRRDFFSRVAVVDFRFENLNLLPGNLRAPQSSYQFFGFARKHRTDDNFYPARAVFAVLPAAKAYICIEEVEYSEGSTCGGGVGTDDKGQFIFTAMNGLRYLIRSHINIQNNQRHAEPLEIPADGDVSGVKLVITEAGGSCEKCRTWKRRKN